MPSHPLDLAGRAILVVGASGGIGREIAMLLSELGARLIVSGRNEERLSETLGLLSGTGHRIEIADLAESERIPQWIKSITSVSGPLNGIVHAAGKQVTLPVRMTTPTNIDDVFRTNLYSAVMLAQGFCQKNCYTQEGGSIVFISSIMGFVGKAGISLYSASKAALSGLCRSLALELAPVRVRVNCVAPAFVETEMLKHLQDLLLPEQFEALKQEHPLGFGNPRDVAGAAAFLLADTGRWITGTTMVVDGGYSAQ